MRAELEVGPYAVYGAIASGGTATVHLGRVRGSGGFRRVVAVKRLRPAYARDPDFVAMLADEARMASRIRHANVAATIDVAQHGRELLLVVEYVHGESLARLLRAASERGARVPQDVACAVVAGVLHGLHAAHEATDAAGRPLGIVHRDVSPQNVLVGADGFARVIDFGVAKAAGRAQPATREGLLKGKLSYMAPEQTRGRVDRRADVYAAGVVLWELLTGRRLFVAESESAVLSQVLAGAIASPREVDPGVPEALSDIVVQALAFEPEERFATARAMALALEGRATAPPSEVGAWVESLAGETLDARAREVAAVERSTDLAARPERRRWIPAAVTLACVALVAVVARAVFAPVAPAPAPAPGASASTTVTTVEPPPAAAQSTSAAERVAPAAASHPPAPRAHAPAGPRPRCDPPYRIDEHGEHHYKPECL